MVRWCIASLASTDFSQLLWNYIDRTKKHLPSIYTVKLPSIYTVKLLNDNCTWLWRLLHYNTCFPFYISLERNGRAWGCVLISSCATFLWSYFFSSKWLLFCSASCQMSFLWQMFPSRKRLVWNTTSGRKKPCKEKTESCFQSDEKLQVHARLLVVRTNEWSM